MRTVKELTRKMKDSGVEWIGEIPEDWEIIKVKQLFKIGRGRVIAKTELDEKYPYPVYSSQTKNDGILGYIQTYDFEGPRLTWTTDGANAGTVFIRDGKYNCTNVCGTLELKDEINDLQYLKYTLEYIAIFHKRADTNGYKIMNNEMANIEIVLPSEHKQKAIADFLDEKTQEIDNIISKTKKAIEEYKRYKQSLITETVTKGLDENVQMKDSGIEWVGEIPKHWDLIRLGFLGRLQNGINKSGEEFGFGYPFINYGDIYRNYHLDKLEYSGLVNSTEKERENYSVKKGDVLFTRTSETKEEIGYAATCLEDIENAVFTGFSIRFRPSKKSKLFPGFSKYYFRSQIHRKYFVKEMNIVTRVSLGQELLMKLSVLLPPLKEQEEIAAYLDQKCSRINQIISTKEKLLTEMEAYKKSLIYETVTGKREVE